MTASRPRPQKADPFAHLYGTVDPIDGIPFRRPCLDRDRREQFRPAGQRCLYQEPGRRGYAVRVRVAGRLWFLGRVPTAREAREIRDEFERDVELLGRACAGLQGELLETAIAAAAGRCRRRLRARAGRN